MFERCAKNHNEVGSCGGSANLGRAGRGIPRGRPHYSHCSPLFSACLAANTNSSHWTQARLVCSFRKTTPSTNSDPFPPKKKNSLFLHLRLPSRVITASFLGILVLSGVLPIIHSYIGDDVDVKSGRACAFSSRWTNMKNQASGTGSAG